MAALLLEEILGRSSVQSVNFVVRRVEFREHVESEVGPQAARIFEVFRTQAAISIASYGLLTESLIAPDAIKAICHFLE